MRVLTVCPTVARFDLLRAFEKSYTITAPPEEPAVFVAMGSDDDTAGYLVERASCEDGNRPYLVYFPETVLPFGQAVNQGVQMGLQKYEDCDVILLANNDLVLQPGWYEALAEAVEGGMDVVGAKLVYPRKPDAPPDSPPLIQHFGKWFSLDFVPFHILRGQPETHPRSQGILFVPDVTFALAAIKREVWEKLGGLDESYVNGFEDDDFCLRAREQGCLIGVHSDFKAVHRESATTGQDGENKTAQWQHFAESWVDSGRIQWALGMFQGWAKT